MQVKIGDMSKLYKISSHTLRYYDEMGIVKAQKNDAGYRYYGIKEMEQLERVTFLRSVGVSIEQIQQFLKLDQISRIADEFQEREKEIAKSIKELQVKQKKMRSMWQSIENIQQHIGTFEFTESPTYYGYFIEEGDMKRWVEICEKIDSNWFLNSLNVYRYDTENIEETGVFGIVNLKRQNQILKGYKEYPSTTCIYTSFIGVEEDLRKYLKSCIQKLETEYEVFGHILVIEGWHYLQDDKTMCASEIWIPARKR